MVRLRLGGQVVVRELRGWAQGTVVRVEFFRVSRVVTHSRIWQVMILLEVAVEVQGRLVKTVPLTGQALGVTEVTA